MASRRLRVFVTGGAGFIGSHVVDELVQAGHQVVVIDNLSTGRKTHLNPKARFYQLDIRKRSSIERVFQKEKPRMVVHLAAQMNVRRSVDDPCFDADVNVIGILSLLEAGRKSGIRRFVFASSGGVVYGDAETIPTPEDYPLNPVSPYGVSKLAGEKYLFYYQKEWKIPFIALRYANVYGPRQNPEGEAGVVSIFATRLIAGQPPVIYGDGRQTRDYVYVQDVARLTALALQRKPGIYNIGTRKETSVNDLFRMMIQCGSFRIRAEKGPARRGEQRRSALSSRWIEKTWGWKTWTPLSQGLSETLRWFKETER